MSQPSATFYFKVFDTNSWNDILKKAKLECNHITYTDNELIEIIKVFYSKVNRVPKEIDFIQNNWTPSYRLFFDRFGSMKQACYKANLIKNKPMTKDERLQVSINELIEISNKLKKCPTVEEYKINKVYGYHPKNLMGNLNMTYNEICQKYLSQYTLNHEYNTKTKEELLEELTQFKDKLGRTPTTEDLFLNKEVPSQYILTSVFNKTYNQIIEEELGWELNNKLNLKSEDEMLEDFYSLFKRLKRIPFGREFDNESEMCGYRVYKRHFKSMSNICNLLNIDYQNFYYKHEQE
jgi:hypothetical protein